MILKEALNEALNVFAVNQSAFEDESRMPKKAADK